jgi:ribosomal protein S18 acetylase RimI-like enzyme
MHLDFSFRTTESARDRDRLRAYTRSQNLGYPNYDDWVDRAYFELEVGYKTGIIAVTNNVVVGDLIFQPDKTRPRTRELKNIRVSPALRDRYVARFMLRQAEQGLGKDFDIILCDVPETEQGTIMFLESCRYRQVAKLHLYSDDRREVVMAKVADPTFDLTKIPLAA